MKPVKSIVLLAAGALALSACDMKKKDNQTTSTGTQETTMGAGTTATDTTTTTNAATTTNDSTVVAPVGGAATTTNNTTEAGSGAVSDEAIREDNLANEPENYDSMNDEVEEQEYYPDSVRQGSGAGDNYEYVDETSSEPDNVRGGRDARMVPKNNDIDNTSSEPDIERQ